MLAKSNNHGQNSAGVKSSLWVIKAIWFSCATCHGQLVNRPQPGSFTSQAQPKAQVSWGCTQALESKKEVWFPTRLSVWQCKLAGLRQSPVKHFRLLWCWDASGPLALPHLLARLYLHQTFPHSSNLGNLTNQVTCKMRWVPEGAGTQHLISTSHLPWAGGLFWSKWFVW